MSLKRGRVIHSFPPHNTPYPCYTDAPIGPLGRGKGIRREIDGPELREIKKDSANYYISFSPVGAFVGAGIFLSVAAASDFSPFAFPARHAIQSALSTFCATPVYPSPSRQA